MINIFYMSPREKLDFVKHFADQAHGTQVRKYTGDRYIVHPVRVMEMVREVSENICMHAAALLHDVLEDTAVTENEMSVALREVLNEKETWQVLKMVVELTDVYLKEKYPDKNRRSRKQMEAERLSHVSADAQTIKYADILDNVKDIFTEDANFAHVYIREAKKMLLLMKDGNSVLREKAVNLVDSCLENLKLPDPPVVNH
jgi:(p)ppGpp synthase/HD superfamily hydrolase